MTDSLRTRVAAMMSCSLLLSFAATIASFLLISDSDFPTAYVAAVAVIPLGTSLVSALRKWRGPFVVSVGLLTVIDVLLIALLSEASVIASWSVFAAGVVALMLGSDSISMWDMVRMRRKVDPSIESLFRKALRRSVATTLLFVATAMTISIVAMAFSLGLELREFSLLLIALCVVAAMAALTLLASGSTARQ